jgi:ATP-binding cassette, subfamily C (CFTR/MRP), member 1
MLDHLSGTIKIDNLDLSLIPRHHIRSRLNALSQEPFFLTGSVRQNLDPYDSATSASCISALEKVKLWDVIEKKGGLDVELSEDMLSHGQRQLFCLARAILRPGKIVVLDEATSSVDRETDRLMQRVIREEFAGRTIIAIAHRLETILDFDQVVVMDAGRIVEVGEPGRLVRERGSWFGGLVEGRKRLE